MCWLLNSVRGRQSKRIRNGRFVISHKLRISSLGSMNWKDVDGDDGVSDDDDGLADGKDGHGIERQSELTADLSKHGDDDVCSIVDISVAAAGINDGGILLLKLLLLLLLLLVVLLLVMMFVDTAEARLLSHLLHNEPSAATDWFLNSVPHLTMRSTMLLAFSFDVASFDDFDDELKKRFDAIFKK